MVKIALVSCGTEYSGIQKEIEKAANKFGAEIILPEIDLDYIDESYEKFGFSAQSSKLKDKISNFNSRASESRMKLASIMPSAAENHVNKPQTSKKEKAPPVGAELSGF